MVKNAQIASGDVVLPNNSMVDIDMGDAGGRIDYMEYNSDAKARGRKELVRDGTHGFVVIKSGSKNYLSYVHDTGS